MTTAWKRSRSRSSRPSSQRATRGVLLRTTGLSGIRQISLELVRLFSKGRQPVLAEQEHEDHPRHSRQLGRETGAQLSGLVQLQGEKQASLRLELVGFFLQGPEDLGRIGTLEAVHGCRTVVVTLRV